MSYNNTRNPYLIYQGIFLLVKIGVVGEDAAITTVGEAVIPNAWSWRNGTHDFVSVYSLGLVRFYIDQGVE